MPSTTPAKATVEKVASELSPVSGRSASAVANATNLSVSTARKALTALREQGRARRDETSADWFAVSVTAQTDDVVADIDAALADAEPRRQPNPFPGEDDQVPVRFPAADPQQVEQDNQLAEDGVYRVLIGWGLTERLAGQDTALYQLLAARGPLRRDEIEAQLASFSEWSLRRLSTGRHQGRSVGQPLIQAVGRGDARTWQIVG